MTEPTNATIGLIASGFQIIYQLYQTVDRTLVAAALAEKVPIPPVPTVPSWDQTEAFITVNPDFLNTDERRDWWSTRDRIQSRADLMIALGRELSAQSGERFYLFAPEVRQDPTLASVILAVTGDVRRLLDDPGLTKDQKFLAIMELLKEATS